MAICADPPAARLMVSALNSGAGAAAVGAAEIRNTVAADPTLKMVSVPERLGLPLPTWKLSTVGEAPAELRNAAPRFQMPAPTCRADPCHAPAVSISRDRYCAFVRPGRPALTTAAAPASRG